MSTEGGCGSGHCHHSSQQARPAGSRNNFWSKILNFISFKMIPFIINLQVITFNSLFFRCSSEADHFLIFVSWQLRSSNQKERGFFNRPFFNSLKELMLYFRQCFSLGVCFIRAQVLYCELESSCTAGTFRNRFFHMIYLWVKELLISATSLEWFFLVALYSRRNKKPQFFSPWFYFVVYNTSIVSFADKFLPGPPKH